MTLGDMLKMAFAGRGLHPVAHDELRKAMLRGARGQRAPGFAEPAGVSSVARALRDRLRPEVFARRQAGETVARISREMGRSASIIDRILSEGPPND